MLDQASFEPPGRDVKVPEWVNASFAGSDVDTRLSPSGTPRPTGSRRSPSATALHVRLVPYDGPVSSPDDLMHFALNDWPYYSGGGFGLPAGVAGDFAAGLDFRAERAVQGHDPAGSGWNAAAPSTSTRPFSIQVTTAMTGR